MLPLWSRYLEDVVKEMRTYVIDPCYTMDGKEFFDVPTVSLYLENAMYGDLFVFVIDIDTKHETAFIKKVEEAADFVTVSKNNGRHAYFGVRKEVELFDSLNLLSSSNAKGFIDKTALRAEDGTKFDVFCDTPRFIYEWQEWGNRPLSDKTQVVFDLLKDIEIRRSIEYDRLKDAEGNYITLDALSESELLGLMTERERLIFEVLKTISADCDQRNWFRIGCDINAVFGGWNDDTNTDLGGSVWLWWSAQGKSFQPQGCANTWGVICNKENRLNNAKWRDIMYFTSIDAPPRSNADSEPTIAEQLGDFALVAKRERTAEVIAKEEEAARGISGDLADDSPLVFRGNPIQWVVIENAKGKNEHFIDYDGNLYRPAEWLEKVFPNYQHYNGVVEFDTDDIFWLSKSQRSKLQYHILALYFGLVEVDGQDQKDFLRLVKSHDGETAQELAKRCTWENGIRKMISFGATLDVRGKMDKETKKYPTTKGVWCYRSEFDIKEAYFESVRFTWKEWLSAVKQTIDNGKRLEGYRTFTERVEHYKSIKDDLLKPLYCQDGVRLTLPQNEYKILENWIFNYYLKKSARIPYTGNINTAVKDGFGFKIVYSENCRIVPKGRDSLRAKGAMAQYNKEHAAEQSARKIDAHGKLEDFPDGDRTAKELEAWGFNQPNLRRYKRLGKIIEVDKRGNEKVYRRVSLGSVK